VIEKRISAVGAERSEAPVIRKKEMGKYSETRKEVRF